MTPITKLSLNYSAIEDRLYLDLRLEKGSVLRMWMTQRLARELVAALHMQRTKLAAPLAIVEVQSSATEPADEGTAAVGGQSVRSEPAAVSEARGLEGPPNPPSWLIQNIVITPGFDRTRVQLKSELDVVPATFIDRRAVAHWLGRLRKYFLIAGWPLDLWSAPTQSREAVSRPGITRH